MKGYDEWKTTNPNDWDLGEREEDCTCGRTMRSRRNCLVHGIDPDAAYDEWRDRQMERETSGAFANFGETRKLKC